MFPVFTVTMARDAVARQFDYDDTAVISPAISPALTDDVAPAALPRRRTSPVRALGARLRASLAPTTWSPSR